MEDSITDVGAGGLKADSSLPNDSEGHGIVDSFAPSSKRLAGLPG